MAPRLTAVMTLLVLCIGATAAHAQPIPSAAPMLADAELTSVCFVDADHGWAVGDRGVIWATSDGGRNWQLQRSPTSCRLESVQFLDTLHGWAVGGFTHPYTHHTSGVVVRTRDGGRTWQSIPDRTLPALKHVKFSDARHGWAAGDASPLYASGIFKSEDGGREWAPVPKGTTHGWAAADFSGDKSGALIGRDGQACVTTPAHVRASKMAKLDKRPIRRLVLAGGGAGWLVGDGGQVLITRDGGNSWMPPPTLPPIGNQFDFAAIAVFKEHCWIAGNPGTCVLHSADGGRTWETLFTQQRAPIRALCFLDENRGWAVGSLGTILATRDGGRNWRVQRSGGARAGMLAVFSEAERLPLAVFAQESASEGYLGVAEVLGRPADADDPRFVSLAERTHEAVTAAGGSHASQSWRFPLPLPGVALTPQAIMDHWNAAADGKAASQLEEHLVRRIRTWRPEVVITENVSPRGKDPLAHVTSQVVLAAVEKAADSSAYPEQLSQQALEPWKVKKVFGVQADSRQGTVNVAPPAWSPRLARSLADVAEAARSRIVSQPEPSPTSIGLSLLVDHLPQNIGRRDIFSGLVLLAGGEARRAPLEPPAGDLDQFARAAQKRHNVEQLLARVGKDSSQGIAMLAQINELTDGIGDRGAGEILLALARRYHEAGKSDAAAETLQLLLDRYPQHALVDTAAIWLVQYYSSSEMAHRQRQQSKTIVQTAATADFATEGQSPSITPAGFDGSDAPANRSVKPDNQRAGKALAVGRIIERTRPALAVDPRLRFPLLSAHRLQGHTKEAEQLFASLASRAGSDPWGNCAVAEQCLLQKTGTPPKTIVSCVSVRQRPKLDGRLDDELWKGTRPASLATAQSEVATASVALAVDDQFLYVAISCPKSEGGNYEADDAPRTHDADLSVRDRVEIHLDIDRDYASFWTLTVDCRGFTHDSVFGDATWNPTWFVARGGDEQFWSAEIAIPLAELCPRPPKPRDAWAIGIQRIIPNVGFQSASHPASTLVRPEGFGLLVFE